MSHRNIYRNISGFTLIELLVVIAIIGILSSVVLAALNSARNKGADSAIKADMTGVRSTAEVQYDSLGNSYNTGAAISSNVCSTLSTAGSILVSTSIQNALKHAKAQSGTDADCGISSGAYSIAIPLKGGGYWCIDNTGVARSTQTSGAAYTALTGAGTAAHTLSGATVCN